MGIAERVGNLFREHFGAAYRFGTKIAPVRSMGKHDYAFQATLYTMLGGMIGAGASVFSFALNQGHPLANGPDAALYAAMLHVAATIPWSVGLMRAAQAKGHSGMWGLLGVLMMLPWIGFLPWIATRLMADRYLEVGDKLAEARKSQPFLQPRAVVGAHRGFDDAPDRFRSHILPEIEPDKVDAPGSGGYRW